jgi:hypothetical protein
MAVRFRNGSDVRSHRRCRVPVLDWCLCLDDRCDWLRHGAHHRQPSLSPDPKMRIGLHLVVVAAVSASGLACSSVIDKEISQVSRITCPDGESLQVSRTTTESGRISASWSCAAPTDWLQYLTKLDTSLSRYQRRAGTADRATYSRHEPGDLYVLTLMRAPGVPARLDAKLVAGPD